MKKIISIVLVGVMALGLLAVGAFAADNAEIKDVAAADGKATVTLTAKDVTYQSAYIEVTYTGGIKLDSVTASDGAKCVNTVTTADEVEGTTKMFAWKTADGVTKIAYANGSDVTAASSGSAIFTLEFSNVTSDATVTANIVFYNAKDSSTTPVEIKAEATGKITASASGVVIGDVTGDGKVDGRDVVRLAKYLAGVADTKINEANTEMINGKAGVNGQDLVRLAKVLAGVPGAVLG